MQCEPDRTFAFDIEAQMRAAMMKVKDAPDTPGKLTLRGVVLTNATSAPLAQRRAGPNGTAPRRRPRAPSRDVRVFRRYT